MTWRVAAEATAAAAESAAATKAEWKREAVIVAGGRIRRMGAKLGKMVASAGRKICSVGVERVMASWSRPHSRLRTAVP